MALKYSRAKKMVEFSKDELKHLAAKAKLSEKLVCDTASETVARFMQVRKETLPMQMSNSPFPDTPRRPAARCARGFTRNSRPANRGRGECRMPNAPAASCAKGSNMHTSIHSEAPENTRHSRTQWFYGLYALSPAS
jgi:hypothetical protein